MFCSTSDKISDYIERQTTTDVLSVLFDVRDKMSEFRSEMEHRIKVKPQRAGIPCHRGSIHLYYLQGGEP